MEAKRTDTGRSVARNVLYGFSTWILPLAIGFAATPVIVRSLGHEDYGIYALVLGFIAYSFNFNVGRAVTKYIAEFRARGEAGRIKDIVNATFFLNLAVGLAGLAAVWLLAERLTDDVFRIEPEARRKTVSALYLAGVIIFLVMLNQVFNAVLQGIQRFDVYSKILNAGNFLLMAGNLLLAWLGYGLLTLLWWNLFVSFLSCSVFFFAARRLLPEFGISFRFGRGAFKLVLDFSWAVIGYQILGNVVLLFERSWITRQLGAESLTFYVVPMTLALYVHGFVASLMMVIFPLASELKDDQERLLRLYLKATKIVAFAAVFLSASLIALSGEFLTLWMGREVAERSANLLVIHAVTFGLMAVGVVAWQVTEGLGHPTYNFFVLLLCLVISVSGMLLLTEEYGNTGAALSRLAGFMLIFFSVFYVEKWFFGRVQLKFWLRLIFFLGLSAAAMVAWQRFLLESMPLGWPAVAAAFASGGAVYLLALWLFGFITDEEKHLIKRLRSN